MDENAAQKARDVYRANQIQTASREQLLLLTYDIGIRSCAMALDALENKDTEGTNQHLQKAQAVIRELMITLNVEQGGEVAQSLMSLYDYLYYQLVEANVHKNPEPVIQVKQMLEELRQTWVEAIDKLRQEAQPEAVTPSPAPVPVQTSAGGSLSGGFNLAG